MQDIRLFKTIDQIINKPFRTFKDNQQQQKGGVDVAVVRSKSQVNLYQIILNNRQWPISDGNGPGQSKYIIEHLKTNTSLVDRCLRRMGEGAKYIKAKYHFYVLTTQHVSPNAVDTFEGSGVQLLQRYDIYDKLLWPDRVKEFAQKNRISWITGDD